VEKQLAYRPELDGLRAIAAIYVVLFHSMPDGPAQGGFVGVDIFFVLSGFLITCILSSELRSTGNIDLFRFYLRRSLRLVPALLLMLACYLVVGPFIWPGYNHGRDALIAATYISNYSLPRFLSQTWSLALEEQFYLIWPLFLPVVLLMRRPALWLSLAWVGITIWRNIETTDLMSYFRFDTRTSGLVLGAAIAFLPSLSVNKTLVAALAFACLFGQTSSANPAITLAEIMTALVILNPPQWLGKPALVQLGKLSYGIYLWHSPIVAALGPHFNPAITALMTLGLSIPLAYLSSITVELWGRALRDSIEARRRVAIEVRAGGAVARRATD
jgi:peptidoglycan/LPS O-acetylase OafA/YrhL